MFEKVAQIFRHRIDANSERRHQPIRVWVAGCATGEELYSLAICLREVLDDLRVGIPLHFFGTDISDASVDRARSGVYPASITNDVSPERLSRFFVKVDSGYQIVKTVREICVFARQDITKDPPFSRMDIVSCRNVLIYMNAALQRRVFPIFHYSLNPDGLLLLGSAESITVADDLFRVQDKQNHIYAPKMTTVRVPLDMGVGSTSSSLDVAIPESRLTPADGDVQKRIERVILNRYSPDSIVVDSDLKILHFRGDTSAYLQPGQGEASLHLLRMAQESLLAPLRRAIEAARHRGVTVREKAIYNRAGDVRGEIILEVTPTSAGGGELWYLIVFQPASIEGANGAHLSQSLPTNEANERIRQLEQELTDMRQYLLNLSEDHEAHSEELRAANEEVRSSNEELQSLNEELGTTKEELQSANVELTTVNEELQNRNQELGYSNSDLKNLLTAVQIPILMVDTNLRLRRFTAAAEKLFNLNSIDIGRPVGLLRGKLELAQIEELARRVLDTLNAEQREIEDQDGRWFSVTVRPYRTVDNRIEGGVITFVDVDLLKRSLSAAEEARDYAEGLIETVREPLLVLDADLRVQRATSSFFETFQVKREETLGRFFYDLGNGQWNSPRLRELIGNALFRDEPFADFEVEHDFPHIGERSMRLNGRRIPLPIYHSRSVLVAIEDITQRRRQAEIRYRRLFETAKDGMLLMDPETSTIEDANPFFSEIVDVSREALIGKNVTDIPNSATGPNGLTILTRALDEGAVRYSELPILRQSGDTVWVDVIANRYELGGRTIVQANFRDVSETRSARSELQASEDRFRRFVDSVRDYALFQLDLQGHIVSWNSGAERVLGYAEHEVIGQHVNLLFTPEDVANGQANEELRRARETGRSDDTRWHVRKDQTRFFATGVMTAVLDDTGQQQGFAKILQDITLRKAAEEELRRSLREKEVLLREVHHRVKNNLQVITSLLNLQAGHLQSAEAAAVLEEMRARVHSLAAIHELLYQAKDFSSINFGEYLLRLGQDLASLYGRDAGRIKIVVDAPTVKIDIAHAVPGALIVNELVMNAVKHAFPDTEQGTINIKMIHRKTDYVLLVSDDGIGLPAHIDPMNSPTMGLQLVSLLTEQLHGTLSLKRQNGTAVEIRFPASG